ncbi:MAG: hypothetical protein HYY37_06170 [Candidatus Aenigmarchaeota archaeon]|nr:hypothetical protein [Candidatus Aenigmarchaeota archaeon]
MKTAQALQGGYRTYYNHVRKHQGLNGMNPAEVAGLKLNLPENRWEGLIRMAIKKNIVK